MKIRISKATTALAIACMLALADTVSAAALAYSGSKCGSAGNTYAGASYNMFARATANDFPSINEANIRGYGNANVKLLGASKQLAALDAKVKSKGNRGTLTVLLRVAGYDVINQDQSFSAGINRSYSKSYSTTFCQANATFWVSGFIPLCIKGSVGGGASMALRYSIGSLRADMSGGPKAWAAAAAQFGLGVAGYYLASVGTTAKLMNSNLRADAGIGFLAGQKKGGVYLDLTPLNANLWAKVAGFSPYIISQWSTHSQTYTLMTIQ